MSSLASNSTSASRRASPPDGGVTGVLIAALGLWAAVVPLVGPHVGFGPAVADPSTTSSDVYWTMVMPGAALVMCAAVLVATDRRAHGAAAAVLAVVAGAWLAVGPVVWSTVSSGSTAHEGPATADLSGVSAGLGVAAVLLAGLTLVRSDVRRTRAVPEHRRPVLGAERSCGNVEPARSHGGQEGSRDAATSIGGGRDV